MYPGQRDLYGKYGTRSKALSFECSRQQSYQHYDSETWTPLFCTRESAKYVCNSMPVNHLWLILSASEKQRNTTIRTMASIETVGIYHDQEEQAEVAGPGSQDETKLYS